VRWGVVSENVNGQDVTEQYVDLESQLKNLRAAESQFLELMKRSGSIADVLAVQRELVQTRSQIERILGQMKYFKESAAMSSLTVNFSTDPSNLPVVEKNTNQWKPWAVVKEAARGLLDLAKSLLNVLIWIVVFIPVWGLVALIIWRIKKHYFSGQIKQ